MEKQSDAAKVRIFPPGIPLLTIFLGLGLQWLFPINLGYALSSSARYILGAGIIIGSILFLGFWAVLLLRRRGQSENPWKPTLHIETQGPFRITRNPMYLQMLLICIGIGITFANWWILLLTPVAAWTMQTLVIKPEEIYLEAKFGEIYLDYKRRVRRWV